PISFYSVVTSQLAVDAVERCCYPATWRASPDLSLSLSLLVRVLALHGGGHGSERGRASDRQPRKDTRNARSRSYTDLAASPRTVGRAAHRAHGPGRRPAGDTGDHPARRDQGGRDEDRVADVSRPVVRCGGTVREARRHDQRRRRPEGSAELVDRRSRE